MGQLSESVARRRELAAELVSGCRAAGTTHAFGVPGGGSNLEVVGAVEAHGMRFVLVHGETAGAIMAGVTGELTGAPGLCVATRGPGAASAVNGAAQALLDRQPMILVTDSVGHEERSRVSHQRLAQQSLLGSVTKASVVLDGADPAAAARVVGLALAAPPGPVHVELDPGASAGAALPGVVDRRDDSAARDAAVRLLRAARRPVVVAGVGAIAQLPEARRALTAALDELGRGAHVPVLTTYKARGITPDAAPWSAGVVTGATIESPALDAADLIVGVGLDPVELVPAPWPYPAPVVLLGAWPIDDSTYFGEQLTVEVVGAPAELVRFAAAGAQSTWPATAGGAFRAQAVAEVLAAAPEAACALTPQHVVTIAREVAPQGTIATVDAGAHMFAAMHLWEVAAPGELLISSGLATMGFALPAAIAAALVRPELSVVCFTGDGGLGMVLAELETLARLHLPVVVVVFNDSALSLIAVKQQPDGQGGADAVSYRATDFAAIARGCGLDAARVKDVDGYRAAITTALARRTPTLIDAEVDPACYGPLLDTIRGQRR
jgi:acetolactate synthase-1/2/3 large subunit